MRLGSAKNGGERVGSKMMDQGPTNVIGCGQKSSKCLLMLGIVSIVVSIVLFTEHFPTLRGNKHDFPKCFIQVPNT